MLTFEQAVRNAIEVEKAAASFYRNLKGRAADQKTRDFFEEMARSEDAHARGIEAMGKRLTSGELPLRPDERIDTVETSPEWRLIENITLKQALELAIEAENNASLYYDAMADFAQGEVSRFFKRLSENELEHARSLRELYKKL